MVPRLVIILLMILTIATGASAQSNAPEPMLPEFFKWFSPPNNPLLRGAWVIGAETEHATYALRAVLAEGGKIPPHIHPDTRYSTVLKGNLYVGFGSSGDESVMVVVPAGGIYIAPAHVPHYLWAKDEEVVYQEAGIGPTATVPVAPQ